MLHFLLYIVHIISEMITLCWVRSGYNATTVKKMISKIYILALIVGSKPQKCNVSNHGIAPNMIFFYLHRGGTLQAVDANQEFTFLVLIEGRRNDTVPARLQLEATHDLTGVDEGVGASLGGVAKEEVLGKLLYCLAIFVLKGNTVEENGALIEQVWIFVIYQHEVNSMPW